MANHGCGARMSSFSRCLRWMSILSMCSAYLLHFTGYAENDAILCVPEKEESWSLLSIWPSQDQQQVFPSYLRKLLEYYIQFIGILFSITDLIVDRCHVGGLIGWQAISTHGWTGIVALKNLTVSAAHDTVHYIKFRYEEATKSPLTRFRESLESQLTPWIEWAQSLPIYIMECCDLSSLQLGLTTMVVGIVTGLVIFYCCCPHRTSKQEQTDTRKKTLRPYSKLRPDDCNTCNAVCNGVYNVGDGERQWNDGALRPGRSVALAGVWHVAVAVGVVCALASIPWEFVRLYQHKVAEHASVASRGVPPECVPESMSVWQWLRAWGVYQFSWNSRPCEEYYKAVLVDPLWEITPMMVLTSAGARVLLWPVRGVSEAAGACLAILMGQVPAHWQPLILLLTASAALLLLMALCRYRLRLPFFLCLEPAMDDGKNGRAGSGDRKPGAKNRKPRNPAAKGLGAKPRNQRVNNKQDGNGEEPWNQDAKQPIQGEKLRKRGVNNRLKVHEKWYLEKNQGAKNRQRIDRGLYDNDAIDRPPRKAQLQKEELEKLARAKPFEVQHWDFATDQKQEYRRDNADEFARRREQDLKDLARMQLIVRKQEEFGEERIEDFYRQRKARRKAKGRMGDDWEAIPDVLSPSHEAWNPHY